MITMPEPVSVLGASSSVARGLLYSRLNIASKGENFLLFLSFQGSHFAPRHINLIYYVGATSFLLV